MSSKAVTGTLKWATGFEGFSDDEESQSGNFLALAVSATPSGSTISTESELETKIDSGVLVVRVTDKSEKVTIKAANDDGESSVDLDLSGLTLTPTIGELTLAGTWDEDAYSIAVTPALGSGNMLRYHVGSSAVDVEYDEAVVVADGWTDWATGGVIADAEADQVVTVVEATTQGARARKVGNITVVAASSS